MSSGDLYPTHFETYFLFIQFYGCSVVFVRFFLKKFFLSEPVQTSCFRPISFNKNYHQGRIPALEVLTDNLVVWGWVSEPQQA